MKSFFVVTALLAGFAFSAQSQAPVEEKKPKMLDHYAGVQINQLLKQIINLNANQVPFVYPYLVTYSVSSAKYGWGINAGVGYNYQKFVDKNTPANRETKIDELFYRVGVGKRFHLGKKFVAGTSLDYIGEYKINKTFTPSVVDFGNQTDSSSTSTVSKEEGKGWGAQVSISFHISEMLLIGTESTFYYMKTEQKENVTVAETFTDNFTGEIASRSLSATNLETEKSDFTITVPLAVFLIFKF